MDIGLAGSRTVISGTRKSSDIFVPRQRGVSVLRGLIFNCAQKPVCLGRGGKAHSKNAFVFPGLLHITGRGGKTLSFSEMLFLVILLCEIIILVTVKMKHYSYAGSVGEW